MFVRTSLRTSLRRFSSQPPPPPPSSLPPSPPQHSTKTKVIYGGVVIAGYLLGVQQQVFLDIRELPNLLQRLYQKTLGDKDATANMTANFNNSVDGTQVATHNAQVTDEIYIDVSVDGSDPQRITLGLYHDVAPKTCHNFETLCTERIPLTQALLNNKKNHKLEGRVQTYVGSSFHRIIPNFMIQGGDWTKNDGTGGRSIFQGSKFRDETNGLNLKHSGAGTLSMANAGPNTNSSQFFITLAATPHLNGRHCIFGKITTGMDVVRAVERCGSRNGTPSKPVLIVGSGLVSRSSHKNRDLSSRSSKWLKHRLLELKRMQDEEGSPTVLDVASHREDIGLLQNALKSRSIKDKKTKTNAERIMKERLGRG